MSENKPRKTPVEDLLRDIPKDSVIRYETDDNGFKAYHSSPIGRLAHEAAAELATLRQEVERLKGLWIPVAEKMPDDGVEVIGFHPDWIDEDFNPNGTRVCFQNDGERWQSARWYDHQDTYINGDERHFGDNPEGSLAPLSWFQIPAATTVANIAAPAKAEVQSGLPEIISMLACDVKSATEKSPPFKAVPLSALEAIFKGKALVPAETAKPQEGMRLMPIKLLAKLHITMGHAKIFIRSREKMHPDGVALYDADFAEFESALSATAEQGKA